MYDATIVSGNHQCTFEKDAESPITLEGFYRALIMQRGIATFTLDYGTCPRWLFSKMVKLGREMTRVLVAEFGPDEFVRRIADCI
jgi:hypothetical protein